jgi:hypothetical protein
MSASFDRRRFLAGSVGLSALGDFAFLHGLPALSAADARPGPATVQLEADTEPLVRLIEDTPRERLLDKIAGEIHGGTSYQRLLAAVFLAGVRGIKPRPVGFKFHAVLVINSAHLASMDAPGRDSWLPLFWAIDNFKVSQAANRSEGGWMMAPVEEGKLPAAHQAKQRFIEAMDNWDEEGADRAITALARTAGATEIVEILWRYGARDFRDIGHKAIYVANAWRTLQAIGWRHAEPVLRSLAFALLEHEGDNPAQRDDERDRPYRENLKRISTFDSLQAQERKRSVQAAGDVLAALRTSSSSDASECVMELLKQGFAPESLWDGLFLTAGELLMRQPGIIGLHCMTSVNALHFAFQNSADDETRRLILLQTPAFLSLFRKTMQDRGKLADVRIDKLEKAELKAAGPAAVEELFADVSKDRLQAARKALGILEHNPRRMPDIMASARRLVFSKGRDSHDYKFSSAALEDYYHVSRDWRARYAAAAMFNLKGAGDPDNDLIRRARAALS